MDISHFYSNAVALYEKVSRLKTRWEELNNLKQFISHNYDAKLHVSLTVSSHHNYNEKTYKEVSIPLYFIPELRCLSEKSVVDLLDAEIKNIEQQVKDLAVEIKTMSHKGDAVDAV